MPEDINDVVQQKSEELSEKLGVKVYPLIFRDEETGTDIIGYIREPNRLTKLRVLDKSMQGIFTASNELYEAVLIKEESNPRLYSERSEDDKFVLGATMVAYELIKTSANLFKKK